MGYDWVIIEAADEEPLPGTYRSFVDDLQAARNHRHELIGDVLYDFSVDHVADYLHHVQNFAGEPVLRLDADYTVLPRSSTYLPGEEGYAALFPMAAQVATHPNEANDELLFPDTLRENDAVTYERLERPEPQTRTATFIDEMDW